MLMTCGWFPGNPGWGVQEKTACGYLRIYDIVEGEAFFHGEGGTVSLPAGQICVLPSAVPYVLTQDRENLLRCAYYHLDIAPMLLREVRFLPAAPGSFFRGFFDAARAAVEEKNEAVLYEMFRVFLTYCREKQLFSLPGGEISRTLEVMAARFERDWTVEELSRMAGYSVSYFIRLFRRETGVSPHQYLIARRMKASLQLLRDRIPISEVARRVGIPELKAFDRTFRQWYGITPGQYRDLPYILGL